MPDNDGYPTEDEKERLRTFEGTWRQYIEYLRSIGNYWPNPHSWGWTEDSEGDPKNMIYEISTGGWSGNEELISIVQDDAFWVLFWHNHRRGGHYTFEVPFNQLDEPVWHIGGKPHGTSYDTHNPVE